MEQAMENLSESRIALIGIVLEGYDVTGEINQVIHEYRQYVVGRMGLPKARENIAVISLVLDAPSDVINALSGKMGMIPGVNCKTIYAKSKETKGE